MNIYEMKYKNRFAFLLPAVLSVLASNCNQLQVKGENNVKADTAAASVNLQQQNTADKSVLAGNWVRTDATYRIEISELHENGKMKAGYFNPKSIHVAEARWTGNDGNLKIFIELRDTNYPGSNYNLSFIPGKDMLMGKYFQAVEGVTYEVQFVRKNEQ
jgi:hypothetical protein